MEGGGAAGGPGSLLRLSRLSPPHRARWHRWRGGNSVLPRHGMVVSHPPEDGDRSLGVPWGGTLPCWGWWQCPAIRQSLPVCGVMASRPPGDRDTKASHSPPTLAVSPVPVAGSLLGLSCCDSCRAARESLLASSLSCASDSHPKSHCRGTQCSSWSSTLSSSIVPSTTHVQCPGCSAVPLVAVVTT